MLSSTIPGEDSALSISDCLLKCSGQDICRRGKSRNIMVILPAELSFQKGAEGKLGYIENFDSQTPDFVVETVEGQIRFKGRFTELSTVFLAVDLQPKKHQSICTDITSRALVFDQGITFQNSDVASIELSQPNSSLCSNESDRCTDTSFTTSSGRPSWSSRFGCSSEALPDTIKVTAVMMGRNSAISRSKSGAAIEGDDSDVVDGSDSGSDEDYGGGFSQSSISRRRKCVPKRSSGDDCDVGGDVPDEVVETSGRRSLRASPSYRRVRYVEHSSSDIDEDSEEGDGDEDDVQDTVSDSDFSDEKATQRTKTAGKKVPSSVPTQIKKITPKKKTAALAPATKQQAASAKGTKPKAKGAASNKEVVSLLSDSDNEDAVQKSTSSKQKTIGKPAKKDTSRRSSQAAKKIPTKTSTVKGNSTNIRESGSKGKNLPLSKSASKRNGDDNDSEDEEYDGEVEVLSSQDVRSSGRKRIRVSYVERDSSTEEESEEDVDDDDDEDWRD